MSDYTTTPTLDMIWLELSQFVSAKTNREIALEAEVKRLREALTRIRDSCGYDDSENFNNDHEGWIWRTANQAITAAE